MRLKIKSICIQYCDAQYVFEKRNVWKTRENVVVLDFLAVDNFDFTRKNFGWKTREIVGDLHFLVVDNFDFPRKM